MNPRLGSSNTPLPKYPTMVPSFEIPVGYVDVAPGTEKNPNAPSDHVKPRTGEDSEESSMHHPTITPASLIPFAADETHAGESIVRNGPSGVRVNPRNLYDESSNMPTM